MKNIVIEEPPQVISGHRPAILRFKVGKGQARKMVIPQSDGRKKDVIRYTFLPTLADYIGRSLPDVLNPRMHGTECAKSDVARKIERTIWENPEAFVYANRGITILADTVDYNDATGEVKITLTDAEKHSEVDGSTTSYVIAKVQAEMAEGKRFSEIAPDERPAKLRQARVPLHVFVNLHDHDLISDLVEGLNTSKQVKSFSLDDFNHKFDWLKDIIDAENSLFKGKIAWDENGPQDTSVLDILALLTLFHPIWDTEDEDGERAPTVAYSAKGRLNNLLKKDEYVGGYIGLTPVILDIITLHDTLYSGFEIQYTRAMGNRGNKLGRRNGVESRQGNPFKLPLTGKESNYIIARGLIYPLLASFRACLTYGKRGERKDEARWKVNPFEFWEREGAKLVRALIDATEEFGSPQIGGKKASVYISTHQKSQLLLNRSDE